MTNLFQFNLLKEICKSFFCLLYVSKNVAFGFFLPFYIKQMYSDPKTDVCTEQCFMCTFTPQSDWTEAWKLNGNL